MLQKNEKFHLIFGESRWIVYCMTLFSGAALAIVNPLTSTLLAEQQLSKTLIGANSTTFWIFLILSSLFFDKKLRNTNLKNILLIGTLISCGATIAFPLVNSIPLWFFARAVIGIGFGLYIVGYQTLVNIFSKEEHRGLICSIFTVFIIIGALSSSIVGPILYTISPKLPFAIGGGGLLIPFLVIWRFLDAKLIIPQQPHTKIFNKIQYPLFTIFCFGFADATLFSLFPLFLMERIPISQIGFILAVFIIGAALTSIPLAMLADRFGRRRIIMACVIVGILSGFGLILLSDTLVYLLIFAFFAGVGIGPIHPISLALTVQDLTKQELPSGTSLFNVFYGLGCMSGPLLSGIMIQRFGSQYIFIFCLALFVSLLLSSLARSVKFGSKWHISEHHEEKATEVSN